MRTKVKLRWLALLCAGLCSAQAVQAEPFSFSDVRASVFTSWFTTDTVDLFSNQDRVFVAKEFQSQGIYPLIISVRVDGPIPFPDQLTDTLRISFTQTGGAPAVALPVVEQLVPCRGCTPGETIVYFADLLLGENYPGASAFRGTVTVDLLGSDPDYIIPGGPRAGERVNSFTFELNAVRPIPEPATMLLLGTGLAGIGGLIRRRRQVKTE